MSAPVEALVWLALLAPLLGVWWCVFVALRDGPLARSFRASALLFGLSSACWLGVGALDDLLRPFALIACALFALAACAICLIADHAGLPK